MENKSDAEEMFGAALMALSDGNVRLWATRYKAAWLDIARMYLEAYGNYYEAVARYVSMLEFAGRTLPLI
jgi:hypothetical protein